MKEPYLPPNNVWLASRVFSSPLFSHFPISASPQTFLSLLLPFCLSVLCSPRCPFYALRSSTHEYRFQPRLLLQAKTCQPPCPPPFIQHVPFDCECLRLHAQLGGEYITTVSCHIVITQPLPLGAAGPYTFGFFTLSPL